LLDIFFMLLPVVALVIGVCVFASHAQAAVPPAPTAPTSTFEQRLAQRKTEQAISLETKDQNRLISTCTGIQGKLRALQQKNTTAFTKRTQVRQQIDGKLWVTIGKLKLAQKDTFNLEKQRSVLAEKTAVFQSTAQLYQQSLDDAVVVNCKSDPAGFKALLETSKAYLIQLRTQSTDSRNYVVNEIKPTLTGFAADLQAKAATDTDEGN